MLGDPLAAGTRREDGKPSTSWVFRRRGMRPHIALLLRPLPLLNLAAAVDSRA
jgi:hypothetical protein